MAPDSVPATFGPPPAHPFVDDPGEVFATDAHRRVLGHLPTPGEPRTSADLLRQRVAEDQGNPLLQGSDEEGEFLRVVSELEADGLLSTDNGLRMTEAGLEAICR